MVRWVAFCYWCASAALKPWPRAFRSGGDVFVEGCQSQVCYCNILDGDPSEIDQRDVFWLPLICEWIGNDLAQLNQVFEADETLT